MCIVAFVVARMNGLRFVMIGKMATKTAEHNNAARQERHYKGDKGRVVQPTESIDSLPLVPAGRRGAVELIGGTLQRRVSRLSIRHAATPLDRLVKWYRRATRSTSNMPMLSPFTSPRRTPSSPRRAPSSANHSRTLSGQARPSSSHARLEAQSEMIKLKEEIESSAYEIRDLEQLSERVKKRSPSIRILTARALPTPSSSSAASSSRATAAGRVDNGEAGVLSPLPNVNSPRSQTSQTGKRLNSLMQEKDVMHRHLVELKTKLEDERREKVALRLKKTSLEEALQHQRLANDIQATSLDRKDRTIADLRSRLAGLESQVLSNRREKDTMDAQIEEGRRRELKLKEEKDEDDLKIRQVESAHEHLVQAYATLKAITKSQVDTARKETELLRAELESHRADDTEQIERIDRLEAAHKHEMAQMTTSMERCRATLYEQKLEQERLLARLSQQTDAAVSQTALHAETVAMLQQQMRECLPYIQRAALGVGSARPPATSKHISA